MAYMLDRCGDGDRLRNRGQEWRLREEREIQWATSRSQPLFYFVTREIVILTLKLAGLVGDKIIVRSLLCVLAESQCND